MKLLRQRGSFVEAGLILPMGLLLMLGGLQLAFYMAGRQAAEMGAYRAARVVEATEDRLAAETEARASSAFIYPSSRITLAGADPAEPSATLDVTLPGLLKLSPPMGNGSLDSVSFVVRHPPAPGGRP